LVTSEIPGLIRPVNIPQAGTRVDFTAILSRHLPQANLIWNQFAARQVHLIDFAHRLGGAAPALHGCIRNGCR
jgi:hypothetical protein